MVQDPCWHGGDMVAHVWHDGAVVNEKDAERPELVPDTVPLAIWHGSLETNEMVENAVI